MVFTKTSHTIQREMNRESLTTPTSQYKEPVRYNALHQDRLQAVTGLRAISIIIIAIRRAVVG